MLNSTAWILAVRDGASGQDLAEAERLARRACKLTGHKDVDCLDTLAYAAEGKFAEALAAGEQAAQLADSAGRKELAREIRDRLELYRAGKPYHPGSPKP